jgi:hypothetical protein
MMLLRGTSSNTHHFSLKVWRDLHMNGRITQEESATLPAQFTAAGTALTGLNFVQNRSGIVSVPFVVTLMRWDFRIRAICVNIVIYFVTYWLLI